MPLKISGKCKMSEKEVVPFKEIVQELWTGGNPLIDPLVPAVIKAWSQVVPESLRPAICLEGIRDGTLHLLVSNPVAGQQLQFLKESIREKINKLLGGPIVKGIRIKTGAFPEMPSAEFEQTGNYKPRRPGKP
jgi:hypothetical protein